MSNEMKPKPALEYCPNCGQTYDPETERVLECPRCGCEGATSCCMTAGRGCPCVECEEGGAS